LSDGVPYVTTNAHVVLGYDGGFYGCNIYFPRPADGAFYDVAYPAGDVELYHTARASIGGESVEGIDYAFLRVVEPSEEEHLPFPPDKPDLHATLTKLCRGGPINIGDKVYLVGYPDIGGDSITMTEGIMSGFEGYFGQWLKISAGASHGNSGGLAIGARNGCSYGIVSKVTEQSGANLTYVLSSGFIQQFLDSLTGESTYESPSPDELKSSAADYLTQTLKLSGITIKYPDGWSATTTEQNEEGAYKAVLRAPLEGALDNYVEHMIVYVYPSKDPGDFEYSVQSNRTDMLSIDPEATDSYTTIRGVRAYEALWYNETAPATVEYLAVFRYGGHLYELVSGVEMSAHGPEFLKLYTAMVDSIRFK
jgi:hypothetical protein